MNPAFRRPPTIHWKRTLLILASTLCGSTLLALAEPASTTSQPSTVSIATDGTLQYQTDTNGNTIPDFSRAGYQGGGVDLPDVPTVLELNPSTDGSDDRARIQQAIDSIAAMPQDANGHRGALLLRQGQYSVSDTLYVPGGVVVRGEGSGTDGTVITATGTLRYALFIMGDRNYQKPSSVVGHTAAHIGTEPIEETTRAITDTYVPWSDKTITLENTNELAVGDRVIVVRPATIEWLETLGMRDIDLVYGDPSRTLHQWKPDEYTFYIERFVTDLDTTNNQVTLDAPLMIAIDANYGGGWLYRAQAVRDSECGIESLRTVASYKVGQETKDTNHPWFSIIIRAVENAWVEDVVALHFNMAISVEHTAAFVTIIDCSLIDPVGPIKGGYRYGFNVGGQYTLVENGYTRNARHGYATSYRTRGPTVFLNCVSELSHNDSGPHQRFAIGSLYDNLDESRDLRVQNRGDWGTGQGWAGAQQVFWNCTVGNNIVVQQPPTAQNYAIGTIGNYHGGRFPDMPTGHIESPDQHVEPQSLYQAQLSERLGTN